MREIKFRGWDGISMIFCAQSESWKHGWNLRWLYDHCGNIMQFTGLHDKNGVEIYEGDIVQSYSHPKIPLNHAIEWRDEITGWWMRNLHGKDDKDGSTQLWVGMKYGPFEVIGNKWENPELLENSDD